ncbi:CAD16 protein, partial [Amia calva]|nr:CAD16 protein [Amia calva]
NFTVTGNDDGIFGFEQGFLYASKPLDREKQPSYSLEVVVTKKGETHGILQSFTIEILVNDKNDNIPAFNEESMAGTVQLGLITGIPFMQVHATDLDDPNTANADLRYSLVDQSPRIPSSKMFQIDDLTGEVLTAVSLCVLGASTLNSEVCSLYNLTVMVKDMGGKPTGYFSTGTSKVDVTENTWTALQPVHLQENLPGPYPKAISQAQWSGSQVEYSLEGDFPDMLFYIGKEGVIYLTGPLDREERPEFQIKVFAERPDGRVMAEPLELLVMVGDKNDNKPIFSQTEYHVVITEHATQGTEIIKVQTTDADDPNTEHVNISYKIVSQTPESPEPLFQVNQKSGAIILEAESLEKAASQYTLKLTAVDLGGKEEGLSSSCTIIVDVVDENNKPPVFSINKFGPFHIPEDAKVGLLVTTITASDEDKPSTDGWFVDYTIGSGNEEETFRLLTDRQTNEASLILQKTLDYEHVQEYVLVLSARNVEALVGGVYGPESTATVSIQVENVNEMPILPKSHYEVTVSEEEQAGQILLKIQAIDPDSTIRYSLKGDTKNYFTIDEDTGEIKTVQVLDREEDSTYTMEVVAEDRENASLLSSAVVTVHIQDVNDNTPVLVGDYSWKYLCTPKWEDQALAIASNDNDGPQHSGVLHFALKPDPTIRRNWKLTPINGTHANLSMQTSYLTPEVYMVPIIISDSGSPTKNTHINLPVTVCQCNIRGNCRTAVKELQGMPTVQSAVGILLGTLGVIGKCYKETRYGMGTLLFSGLEGRGIQMYCFIFIKEVDNATSYHDLKHC